VAKSLGMGKAVMRRVVLTGLRPVMMDRYAGDNRTELAPQEKLYLQNGVVGLPADNLMSFLTATNTMSAPKRLLDQREYRKVCAAFQAFVLIKEDFIPFLRDGKPILFGILDGDRDPKSGIWIDRRVARLEKGIPNPKVRPVLGTPWELAFTLDLYENDEVQEDMLRRMFIDGGIAIGLGTFRGRYGKFAVSSWK